MVMSCHVAETMHEQATLSDASQQVTDDGKNEPMPKTKKIIVYFDGAMCCGFVYIKEGLSLSVRESFSSRVDEGRCNVLNYVWFRLPYSRTLADNNMFE